MPSAIDVQASVFMGPSSSTYTYTPAFEVHTSHGVNQQVGTASLVLPLPRPVQVTLNADVLIQGSYGTTVHNIFSGRIPNSLGAFSEKGGEFTVACVGYASFLAYPDYQDLLFTGPISLKEIFRSLCARRGVPNYLADETTYPDGVTTILLGGNAQVDGGLIRIPAQSSPLSWLDDVSRLFGYRVFDTPGGQLRLKRVSGLPTGSAASTYVEGVNVYDPRRRHDLAPMVTYWDVRGAAYTATDGTEVAIRSIPATVPTSQYLDPPGFARDGITDERLTSVALATAVRNVMEIDRSTPYALCTWETEGEPARQPGDVVALTSPSIEAEGNLWLTRLNQEISASGYYSQMEGWAGAGQLLPAGNDCVSRTLLTALGRHLGNEYLSHYRRGNPDGLTVTLPFTVENDYTSMKITGYAHGCNSFSGNVPSTVSRFEIWQGATKKSSGNLPFLKENFEQKLNYNIDSNWERIAIPMPGSLVTGSAELRIISAYDSAVGDYDDFEVRSLILETCGVGTPVII